MRKLFFAAIGVFLLTQVATAQTIKLGEHQKPVLYGIHFGMFDFKTPLLFNNAEVGSVIAAEKWAKLSEMSPALGISMVKGLSNYFDLNTQYFLSSVNYPQGDKNNALFGGNYLLHQGFITVNAKLIPDTHTLVPYATVGVGASYYKQQINTVMPVGVGLQFKLNPTNFVKLDYQYVSRVTGAAANHFIGGIGFITDLK